MKRNVQKTTEVLRIIVPYDFSHFSKGALAKAVSIASAYNTQIDLIHVVTPIYVGKNDEDLLPETDIFYSKLLKGTELKLNKVALSIKNRSSLEINVKSYLGIVHQVILKHSKKVKADLVVMGTHGVSGFKEFFLGSNAFRVVNESTCPVITIQRKIATKLFKRILVVLTDETSIEALINNVVKFVKPDQSQICIASRNAFGKSDKDLFIRKMILFFESQLKKKGIPFTKITLDDKNFIRSVIASAKKIGAGSIAISINKKFHFNQIISGSYAQQIVNHSSIPVLSVP